jgi:hypothetical protein
VNSVEDGAAKMTTKKNKNLREEPVNREIKQAQSALVAAANKKDLLNNRISIEEIIKEHGIKPIKDDSDFERIFGGYKEWFDIDEFLKEAHKSRK